MHNIHLRKVKILIFSRLLWRKRLVFWCGAIAVGLIASYFAIAADYAHYIFTRWTNAFFLLPLVISPLIFAFSAWATERFFPGSSGSGIPQTIAARILRDDKSRNFLLGPHLVIGKMLLTLLGLLAGASVGREGPTVQVGAAIMLLCARLGGLKAQRGVVLAGAAAGVAAAFNTPLAGIVFAIEEMARAFEHRGSSIVLIAIVLAGAASMSVLGNYSYFGSVDVQLLFDRDWASILVTGVTGGILGSAFVRLIIDGGPYVRELCGRAGLRSVGFAAICGLVVATLGILTHGATYGTGYTLTYDLLHGGMTPSWWQLPAKFITTTLSTLSGIPGGLFSPSLSVGATMGAQLSPWLTSTPLQGIILLSMVAYFAGVTQAPITAFVIVLEITGKGSTAVPLIAAGVIAAGVARLLCPVSLYHALAKTFITRARSL